MDSTPDKLRRLSGLRTEVEVMEKEVLEALSQGAWGNYLAIHFLEWLAGERKIDSPKDIGIEINELPRLIEQAKCYESNCVTLRSKHLTTAST